MWWLFFIVKCYVLLRTKLSVLIHGILNSILGRIESDDFFHLYWPEMIKKHFDKAIPTRGPFTSFFMPGLSAVSHGLHQRICHAKSFEWNHNICVSIDPPPSQLRAMMKTVWYIWKIVSGRWVGIFFFFSSNHYFRGQQWTLVSFSMHILIHCDLQAPGNTDLFIV